MATRLDAIKRAWRLAEGKSTSTLPPTGNRKRDILTDFAIDYYRDWQVEPGVEWESLSQDVSAGTVTADNDTYDLSEDIHFISKDENNYVVINEEKYKVVSVRQLSKYAYGRAVAHIVQDGTHSIKFSRPFREGDALIGKEILVPCIIKLDDINSDESDVLIDNPEWLAVRVAAQYCDSFPSKRERYSDLLEQANELMMGMKSANETGNASYNTGIDYFASIGNVGHEL